MKIAILTQPLQLNYGGLLQNYALQQVLKGMGHEVETLTLKQTYVPLSFYRQMRKFVSSGLFFCLGRIPYVHIHWPYNTKSRNKLEMAKEFGKSFTFRHIQASPSLDTLEQLQLYCRQRGFEAYVVGSDQVWRPKYNVETEWMFLSFLSKEDKVKRIAYAASFGTDKWGYNSSFTETLSAWAKRFDAVSVREDSGVNLCKDHLGVAAQHVLDPTLLLDPDHYLKVVEEAVGPIEPKNQVFAYVLDKSGRKSDGIEAVAKKWQATVKVHSAGADAKPYTTLKAARKIERPSVPKWLKDLAESRFVVTDSFHGTVFAILFNRSFVVFGNEERGMSRFLSLLKIFGLEDRMVQTDDEIEMVLARPIDWNKVNAIRNAWKKESLEFLERALSIPMR